jgi:hypothetical protein
MCITHTYLLYSASSLCVLSWNIRVSIAAAHRLLAAVIACISPVNYTQTYKSQYAVSDTAVVYFVFRHVIYFLVLQCTAMTACCAFKMQQAQYRVDAKCRCIAISLHIPTRLAVTCLPCQPTKAVPASLVLIIKLLLHCSV